MGDRQDTTTIIPMGHIGELTTHRHQENRTNAAIIQSLIKQR